MREHDSTRAMSANPWRIIVGDCIESMRTLPAESVHTCVTSPPYFGLRDYGAAGQIGLEATPNEYVTKLVEVFREVRRVLRDDGTVWLNLGDSYTPVNRGEKAKPRKEYDGEYLQNASMHSDLPTKKSTIQQIAAAGFKQKDLLGIPWMVAFALRADGWCLRQDIIWHKPNPMPESVTDRCTKSHEYIFLLAKSRRYYFDHEAIKEPVATSTKSRLAQPNLATQAGSARVPGKTNGNMKAVGNSKTRNRRDVWTVTTKPFKGAHFATFPPDLIEPCILAGAPLGGTVLDPFGGSGTTALVAAKHGRYSVLCELNPEYVAMTEARLADAEIHPCL